MAVIVQDVTIELDPIANAWSFLSSKELFACIEVLVINDKVFPYTITELKPAVNQVFVFAFESDKKVSPVIVKFDPAGIGKVGLNSI